MITLGSVTNHRAGSRRGGGISPLLPGHAPGLLVICLLGGLALAWISSAQSTQPAAADLLAQADPVLVDGLRADDTDLFAEAHALYLDVLTIEPNHPEALRGAAIADLGLHRFDLALDRATQATTLRPDDHVALAALIDANIELGYYDDAELQLDRMLTLRPGLEAMSRLSYLRQLTGDDAGALEAMYAARTAASGLAFETARINALIGELEFTLGNNQAASQAYRLALALDPSRLDAMVGAAAILLDNGDPEAAEAAIDQVFAIDPGDASALALDAQLAFNRGDTERALASSGQIAADALGEDEAGFGIDPSAALAVSSWGDPDLGLELATIIYDARPKNIKAAHAYAWALHQAGASEDALAPLAVALQFGTTDDVLIAHAEEIRAAAGP